nr:hypothetical protein [Rhodospirillales bacterium]
MALKLFNHRVNPSFGQHAIGGPTRVASAKAAANSAMGNAFANATASVAKYVSAQNAAEDDLLLQKEISESKKRLEETEGYFYERKVYESGDTNAPDGLDDYVKKWQEESGADLTKPVYIDQIFPGYIESQYDSVMNGSLSRLGKSNQSAYIKSMTPGMLESANSSNETSVKLQNARITSEATANIDEAMRLGKTQEALDLIKGYEDKHIFLPHVAEEFRSKATSDDTLGKSQYLSANQVLNSDDSVAIDALEASLWEPDSDFSKMKTEQKIKIQKSINDREKKRDDKVEAHTKKVTDDNSKRSLSTIVAVLAETKDVLSFAEVMDATKGLEPIDQLAFIKINNAKKQRQEGVSDERVMSRINLAVLKLATP